MFEIFSTNSCFLAHWIVDQQHDLVDDITDTKSWRIGIVAYEHTFEHLFKVLLASHLGFLIVVAMPMLITFDRNLVIWEIKVNGIGWNPVLPL